MYLREASTKRVINHLTHLEDLVITNRWRGATEALDFVRGLSRYLAGKSDAPINLQVKMDGAPSIVLGRDPKDGRFFLGTKGAFSKDPKIAKSSSDIPDLYDTPGLVSVMTQVFEALKDMTWPSIVQGDLLWTPDLKKSKVLDHVECWTFQPNTILYAVPKDSKLGRRVEKAKIGIALHTTYHGDSLANLTAIAGVDLKLLKPSDDVCLVSNDYRTLAGTVTCTKAETQQLTDLIRDLETKTSRLKGNGFLKMLDEWPILRSEFMGFQNYLIKHNKTITLSSRSFGQQFVLYLAMRQQSLSPKKAKTRMMVPPMPTPMLDDDDPDYVQEMSRLREAHQQLLDLEARKADAAGQPSTMYKVYSAMAKAVASLYPSVVAVLDWQKAVVAAKTLIMKKLAVPSTLSSYYETDRGLVAGAPEGYVASDEDGQFVKLVDRSVFSRYNFQNGKFSRS